MQKTHGKRLEMLVTASQQKRDCLESKTYKLGELSPDHFRVSLTGALATAFTYTHHSSLSLDKYNSCIKGNPGSRTCI